MKNKNEKQLVSFVEYCQTHPEERFWQALRNWSGNNFILKASGLDLENGDWFDLEDTFYDEE